MTVLHRKFRPTDFDEVVGQKRAVLALAKLIEHRASHAFLISGASGVGKTTLARIGAERLGCPRQELQEIDGATCTGVDDARQLRNSLAYLPLGLATCKVILVDECHRLSAAAWDCLLKVIEEPPRHVFWFFCTTEPKDIPPTVRTRCACIALSRVGDRELEKLLRRVCREEAIEVSPPVADTIVASAHGSPRQLLVNLAMCRDLQTRREAEELLLPQNTGLFY